MWIIAGPDTEMQQGPASTNDENEKEVQRRKAAMGAAGASLRMRALPRALVQAPGRDN